MADNKRSFPWTALVGDGLLLLCALMGFTGSFLSLYGDPNASLRSATALDRCAANGDLLLIYAVLFGLTTLAVWSLPRFRGAAAGGLTALWAVVVLWNRAEVAQGAGVTLREITALFARRVVWGQVFSYESGLSSSREAAAAQFFLLLMLAGLALLLGWAVVRLRKWWAVLFLTLPPLLPGLLADLYPDWLSFMALAACWCAMLLTALCRRAAPDGWGKLTLVALPAAALTLALITAIFPREGYTRPAWALKAREDLLNFTNRLADYLPRWDAWNAGNSGPFQSNVTYVGAAEEADLAHAGPLNYTGRTVLRVTSDYDGRMYLRGTSLAVYEDGVWKTLPDGTYDAYWSDQEPEVSPLFLPSVLEPVGRVYTATVDIVGARGLCVYTPYFPLSQDAEESGMLPVEDVYFARRGGQWSHTMTFIDLTPRSILDGGAYNSIPREGSGETTVIDGSFFWYDAGDSPFQASLSAYTEYVYENYLDVPEDLRDTLRQYAFSVSAGTSYVPPLDKIWMAEQLGAYLDTICEYDASAPAAPAGVDPVYYFLTESHRGYCMHYASAVTLMLRAAGIPARYVSGFAAEISPGRRTNIPDRAAHAWVEVWVEGFGWYPVEVTPAAAFDWTRQPGAQETDEPVEDTPEPTETPEPTPEPTETPEPTAEPTETPEPTPEPTDAPGQPTDTPPGNGDVNGPEWAEPGLDVTPLFNALKVAASVAGILFLIWSIQFAVKRFRTGRMSGADANRSALACYNYLCRLERWGGRTDPRAVELARKARFSQHTLTEEELDLLRSLVDRERYRLCAAFSLPKRLVFRYWWGRPKTPVPPAQGE